MRAITEDRKAKDRRRRREEIVRQGLRLFKNLERTGDRIKSRVTK
jgi:hypothetical protein